MASRVDHLLDKLQRLLRVDVRYLLRGGSWLMLAQIIATITGLGTTIALANILPKEVYGQYRFVLSASAILFIAVLPGMANAITRMVARGGRVHIPATNWARIKWGFIGSVISLGLTGYYLWAGNASLAWSFVILAVFLPFFDTYLAYTYYYKGKENFRMAAINESWARVIQAVLVIGAMLIVQDILVLLLTYYGGRLITNWWFYQRTLKKEPGMMAKEEEASTRSVIQYGKELSWVGALGTVTGNLDKILVWYFLSGVTLASYHIALTIPINAVLFVNVLSRIAFPKFSRKTWHQKERRALMRKIVMYSGVLLVAMGVYMLVIPYVLPFLFRQYDDAVGLAIMLGALIPIMPLNAILAQVFRAAKATRNLVWLRVVFPVGDDACLCLVVSAIGGGCFGLGLHRGRSRCPRHWPGDVLYP